MRRRADTLADFDASRQRGRVGHRAGRKAALGLATIGLIVTGAVPIGTATAVAVTPVADDAAPTISSLAATSDNAIIPFDGSAFSPAVSRLEPGTTIEFRNEGPNVLSIRVEPGGYNVSPIPAGGAAVTMLEVGAYRFTDATTGAAARLLIGSPGFGAPPGDPVENHIPDGAFPPEPDRPPYPITEIPTSTSRIRLAFVPDTTVAEAESAMANAGAVVAGGLPSSGIVLALVPGGEDHSALDASLAELRSDPVVYAAAPDRDGGTNALPPPPEDPILCPAGCGNVVEWSLATTDDGVPIGNEITTWVHEAPRFPQAWNLADNISPTPVVALVIDQAFAPDHHDLANFTWEQLCIGDSCSNDEAPLLTSESNPPPSNYATGVTPEFVDGRYIDPTSLIPLRADAHGSNVASLLGGVHESPGFGTSGANPRATMIGIGLVGDLNGTIDVIEEVLDLKESGHPTYRDVRVMNLSWGWSPSGPGWAAGHRELVCGPAADDDDLPGTDGPCLPWTHDPTLQSLEHDGKLARLQADRMVDLGVVLAQSAGNAGNVWCVFGGQLHARSELGGGLTCTAVPRPSALSNSAFTIASEAIDADGDTNPIFVVEALGHAANGSFVADPRRALFSQMEGHFSAPGMVTGAATTRDDGVSKHTFMNGTSQATPIVAGLLSYLVQLDPTVTVGELRDRVATFDDAFDPEPLSKPAPRIDAFGSVMRVPGALEALLDVDDGTLDGNRRIVYGPGGSVAGIDTDRRAAEPLTTAKTIDIADFRRYRDAWLAGCVADDTGAGCDAAVAAGIVLDGDPDHAKQDLNLDGCVSTITNLLPNCPEEQKYPRVDFNGDGVVDSVAKAAMEIDGASRFLSDLGVLAARFTSAPAGEGWVVDPAAPEELLQGLLISGDVEVHLAGLLAGGATDVTVELRDDDVTTFVRPLSASSEAIVVTVPAGRPVDIVVEAQRNGEAVEYSDAFHLAAGEDVRYDPCNVLQLTPESETVAIGGTIGVTAELVACDPVDLSGHTVEFDVTRNGLPTDTIMDPTSNVTIAGVTTTTMRAGTTPGPYEITATASLPFDGGTIPVEATALVDVETGYAISLLDTAEVGRLGTNPSVASDGAVTYTARSVAPSAGDSSPPFDQIWRSDALDQLEIAQRARDAVPDGSSFGTRVDARADEWAFVRSAHDNEAPNDGDRLFTEHALRLFGFSGGSAGVTVLASAVHGFLNSGPLIDVGIALRNESGQELLPIQRSTDITERLAKVGFGTLAQGPLLGIEWPRLADDSTSVGTGIHFPVATNAGGTFVTTALLAGELAMGTPTTAAVTPIAVVDAPDAVVPTDWTLIGDKPDISASGDVIAFVADRGPGPSTYVSVRIGGGFTAPIAISGPDRVGTPELDLPSTGLQNLTIDVAANEHDLNVGVVHHEAGNPGLEDDEVIVAVFGRPELEPERGGLYTLPIQLAADGTPRPGDARPVVEIGDIVDGSAVELIGWHRVLNSVETSSSPREHQLAYWARTTDAEHIMQANWIATDEGAAAPFAARAALADPATDRPSGPHGLASNAQAALDFGDGRTVPVLIISDATPAAGETIVAVNRTMRDGELADATIEYPGSSGFPTSGTGQQVLIAPPPGPFTITLTSFNAMAVGITIQVAGSPSLPPIADAGGPYTIETGEDLVLDATGSSDPDGSVVAFGWDLDGDGAYDNARGATPRVPWASVAEFFCDGNCDSAGTYAISVEVVDDESAVATADSTVHVNFVFQDFSLALVPTSQPANPGANHIYRVEVGTVGGFTADVTLSVDPLPDGYRTTLASSRVAAPGSVDLSVFVPSDAEEGEVPIIVRGVTGGVEHDTTGSADVSFGLIPICFEPVSGIVVDASTGEPLPDRSIRIQPLFSSSLFATTDAAGRFEFADIRVQSGKMPVTAEGDGQYFEVLQALNHRCDDPIDARIGLVEREYVAARGHAVVGVPDPADASALRGVVATTTPVEGATVRVNVFSGATTPSGPTPADGSYLVDDVPLSAPDNAGARGWLTAEAPGHWPYSSGFLDFTSGPPVTIDVPLVPTCMVRAGVRGRVTDIDGNGMPGRTVRLDGSGGPPTAQPSRIGSATTDADGHYEIAPDDSFLGRHNSAYGFSVTDRQFTSSIRGSFTIDRCGAEVIGEVDYVLNLQPPPPPPVRNLSTITGRIIDSTTGEPLRLTARVFSGTGRLEGDDTAAADGRFEIDILVGLDAETLRSGLLVSVLENISEGYRGKTVGPFTVSSDEPYDVGDIEVDPVLWAGLRGRAVDVATGLPLADATVAVQSGAKFGEGEVTPIFTDADGFYEWNHLAEAGGDTEPFNVRVLGARFNADIGDKYWNDTVQLDVTPGVSTVQDFALLRVCEDVTIRGIVIDAITREPINGARIVTSDNSTEFTDENGFFLFERLRAGSRNAPTSLRLTASATGYVTQSRDVSVFCGSTITVNFGVETGSGSVFGTVTDETGATIDGAFVGSGAGGSDSTGADGTYAINDIPLGVDGGPTDWDITAIHPDGRQLVSTATITDGGATEVNFVFEIRPNAPPLARDVSATVVAGSSVDVTLDGFDADGDTLTYALVDMPSTGSLSGAEPDLAYLAPAGFDGDVTFTYTVSDAEETSPPGTVTVTVEPPNTPPTAVDISVSVVEGGTVGFTLSGSDPDDDPFDFEITRFPAVGYVSGDAPDLAYHAPADGGGEVVTLIYVTDDGDDSSPPATVTITIDDPAPNLPPAADDITTSVVAGESVPITLTGTDDDGDALTFIATSSPAAGSLSGSAPNLLYHAPVGFEGEVTFEYTAFDGEDTSLPATVTITVELPPPNTPPVAFDIDEHVTAGDRVDITLDGEDDDGDPITFAVVTQPAVGTLTGDEPDLVYEAPDDFTGTVTFTYTAHDGKDTSAPATVSISVEPAPMFATVFGTVTDDLGAPVVGAIVFSDEAQAFAFVGPDGSYLIRDAVVPGPGGAADALFSAFHPDGRQIDKTATLVADTETELNFVFPTDPGPGNTPPAADDITTSVIAGESVDVTLTGRDADDDPLTFEVTSGPDTGSVTGDEPDVTYHAPADVGGTEATFQYVADDGTDPSEPATVTITILEPPDTPPTLDPIDDITMDEGDIVDVSVSAHDIDGDAITITMTDGPSWAAPNDLGGGSGLVTLTPADDAMTTVTVEACAGGACDKVTFAVTVVNVDPVLQIEAPPSTAVGATVAIVGTATDPGADEWSYQIDCGDGFGDLQPSPEFECSFDDAGTADVSMRVVDDDGGEGTAATTIDVVEDPELSVIATNDGPAPWGVDVQLVATPTASGLVEPIMYRWDFDSDGAYDTAPTAEPTTVTQYASPGSWTATVEACSGSLCASGTTEVEIRRRPSWMSSPSGPEVQYSDATIVSSTLIDALDGSPLATRAVELSVDGTQNDVITDAAGAASVGWTALVGVGTIALNASFAGDAWYGPSAASGGLDVIREDAHLEWIARPTALAPTYDVHVVVREAEDGALGDLTLTAVSFWLDEGCDGVEVSAGTYPVIDDEADGVGEVIATIDGLAGPGCVRAELTALDGTNSLHYTAAPAEASVGDVADGFVTGGGRYETPGGWVSAGFVARREGGMLSGHVEIVHHGADVVQHRMLAMTGLSIVDDPSGGTTATITARFLKWTADGWVETDITFVAHDGGKGRSKDWMTCDTCPPMIESTFRGQVVVHRKRRKP